MMPSPFSPLIRLLLLTCLVTCAPFLRAQVAGATAGDQAPAYRITHRDRVRIEVYGQTDLATIASVEINGTVNLKLVGEVQVAGLTISEAQLAVEAAYRDGRFLRAPQVTINMEEYAPREVSIQGEVRQPGRYNLPPEVSWTVVDLISRAQGLTDTARGSAVTVSRLGPDGRRQTVTIDAESIIRGRSGNQTATPPFYLQPGDVVNVPQRIF